MKRLLSILILLAMVSCAYAENIDLTGLSYEELVTLKDRINLAMWESKEWQEVVVPQGVWIVGKDIPAGHWTIKPHLEYYASVEVTDYLDVTGKSTDRWNKKCNYYCSENIYNKNNDYFEPSQVSEFDVVLKEGLYVVIKFSPVTFTPYTGKPSLGFK
jgi:hypothetical protein